MLRELEVPWSRAEVGHGVFSKGWAMAGCSAYPPFAPCLEQGFRGGGLAPGLFVGELLARRGGVAQPLLGSAGVEPGEGTCACRWPAATSITWSISSARLSIACWGVRSPVTAEAMFVHHRPASQG